MLDFTNILSGKFWVNGGWKTDIYIIKNKVNGCVYVGQSDWAPGRWKQHKRDLNNGKHFSKRLQNDWNTYGEESFDFSILERVFNEYANKYETMWIKAYAGASCYNNIHNKVKS